MANRKLHRLQSRTILAVRTPPSCTFLSQEVWSLDSDRKFCIDHLRLIDASGSQHSANAAEHPYTESVTGRIQKIALIDLRKGLVTSITPGSTVYVAFPRHSGLFYCVKIPLPMRGHDPT